LLNNEAHNIYIYICENIDHLPSALCKTIDKAYIQKKIDRYIEGVQDGIVKTIDSRVNESDEECVRILQQENNAKALDQFIKKTIRNTADSYFDELHKLADEIIAYLEYIKSHELDKQQIELKKLQWNIETMQRLFYKPSPFEECFTEMDLLYQFLNNKTLPKRMAASCNGCKDWNISTQYCSLYKCRISIIPLTCSHWAVKSAPPAPAQSKQTQKKPTTHIITSKCGGCVFYGESNNLCKWLKTNINELIAGCSHYKTARELYHYCPNCGKYIDKSDKFCGYCGAKAYSE
jgi:hypothetical protein